MLRIVALSVHIEYSIFAYIWVQQIYAFFFFLLEIKFEFVLFSCKLFFLPIFIALFLRTMLYVFNGIKFRLSQISCRDYDRILFFFGIFTIEFTYNLSIAKF